MDISSKDFVIYAVDGRKKVKFKGTIEPTKAGLKKLFKDLGPEQKLAVFEAGNQMRWIADCLNQIKNVVIHVVHPNEVKWITQSKKKTDKVDAKKLAELARGDHLPRKVHVVTGEMRELRDLISAREQLLSKRVSLLNSLRGYLKQAGVKLGEKFFQRKDWEFMLMSCELPQHLRIILGTMMTAIKEIQVAENHLLEQIYSIKDKRIELVESIPCIGKLSARVIVSAIDDVKRFDNKKSVARYSALTPSIYQSVDVTNMGKINRDGRLEVRRAMLQCAHTITRTKNLESKPLREFFERISERRGKKKAVVALAKKLVIVAYGVLKSGNTYDPRQLIPNAA